MIQPKRRGGWMVGRHGDDIRSPRGGAIRSSASMIARLNVCQPSRVNYPQPAIFYFPAPHGKVHASVNLVYIAQAADALPTRRRCAADAAQGAFHDMPRLPTLRNIHRRKIRGTVTDHGPEKPSGFRMAWRTCEEVPCKSSLRGECLPASHRPHRLPSLSRNT